MEKSIMNDYRRGKLEQLSGNAINNGNKFQGFFGYNPEDLTKEELIMVCNYLNDCSEASSQKVRDLEVGQFDSKVFVNKIVK